MVVLPPFVFTRANLYGNVSRLSCRLIASSSPTAVRRSEAEVQTNTSPREKSPGSILSQRSGNGPGESFPQSRKGVSMTGSGSTSLSHKPAPSTADVVSSVRVSHVATSIPSSGPTSTETALDQPFPAPYQHAPPLKPHRSPISDWILSSPVRTAVLLKVGDWLGYGSPKQVAGRRSKIIYSICSEVAQGREQKFWYDTLTLPPSFQSWFTITNLHVWLATVRLRALPPSHGRQFIQALVDHFFFDVEDRLRAVLGKKAPERLVTRQMKIFRDQFMGLGIACDIALIAGDKDMASVMWRNLLGARGARGIADLDPVAPSTNSADNPNNVSPLPLFHASTSFPETPSTGGVTDFEGSEIDKYVMYPQLMLALTSYIRRELVRLQNVSDTTILGGEGQGLRESMFEPSPETEAAASVIDLRAAFKFGSVKDAARKIDAQIDGL